MLCALMEPEQTNPKHRKAFPVSIGTKGGGFRVVTLEV